MKTLFLASALTLFTAGAVRAQDNETITGNGKVVTANVDVQPFTALEASGVYELRLTQGDKESVKIEADENLQALFYVRNEGSKLVIDMGKRKNAIYKKSTKMIVHVTFKTLRSLDLEMVGNVRSEGTFSLADITIDNNSVGNVDLSFTAKDVKLENNSVGNVSLKVTANRIEIDNESVGKVTLTGRAQTAVMKHDGVGSLQAGDLLAQTVHISNSGVGHAEVNAEKELKVKDSFLGKVHNKGAARVQKTESI